MNFENIVDEELAIPYFRNFITKEKEAEIFMYFNKVLFDNSGLQRNDTKGRNKIVRFGSTIPYYTDHTGLPIPDIFKDLLPNKNFTSVTINEYHPGQSIDYHVDSPPSKEIMILSLCSSATLKFRKKSNRDEIVEFELEQFSLAIIQGDLRWNWEHSLCAENYRISVVFR